MVQGLNDPRVPASESQQMVAKIRARGGEVWYLAAKDEGHGFRKKPNRDFYQKTIVTFLEKQLAPSSSPCCQLVRREEEILLRHHCQRGLLARVVDGQRFDVFAA